MIRKAILRSPWKCLFAAASCTVGALIVMDSVQAQQSSDPKTESVATMDKTGATDDWIVLQLIDEDGRPVAGARVSPNVGLDDPRLADRQLDWSEAATSDENGQVAIRTEDLLPSWSSQTSLYILHEERGIGASPKIPHTNNGEGPPVVLTRVCRVHGKLNAGDVPESIPLISIDTIVFGLNTSNWMLHGGFSATGEQDLELLLSPGEYSLIADVIEDLGQKGSYFSNKVRRERRTITVVTGQRDLDLGMISFRPTKAWSLIGRAAPEIGPMKEWKNGSPVTLADLRGQVVWLHFGGDKPFVAGSPAWLTDLHSTFGSKGLTIIGIYSCDSMEELEQRWAEDYRRQGGVPQVPFRIALDGEGPVSNEPIEERPGVTHERYGADGVFSREMNVLIDRTGNIVEIPDTNTTETKAALSKMLDLPPEEPDPARFRELYSLEDSQTLKRIAPPLLAERRTFIRGEFVRAYGSHYNSFASIPSRAVFGWNGGLKYTSGFWPSPTDLESILTTVLGLQKDEYDGPQELLYLELPGDWIICEETSLEAKFLALEGIIERELGRRVRFEKHMVEREAIVATGTFHLDSSTDPAQRAAVHLYAGDAPPYAQGYHVTEESVADFLAVLADRTRTRVIDRTEPVGQINIPYCHHASSCVWAIKDPQERQRRTRILLDHVTKQMQLEFEIRKEPLGVWFITEQNDR